MLTIFITLTILLLYATASAAPLEAALRDTIGADADLQAELVASRINMLAAAPEGTQTSIQLPSGDCTLSIHRTFINYTAEKSGRNPVSAIKDIIQTPYAIDPEGLERKCPERLSLKKESGRIMVR
ncbi:MAG: hypothetical protein HYW27_00625 [Candidatus Aenigmarchaeota archaeon]|nr:hypothetical protein [Candidatus Aenigmarchaeota archaeon]